jgi:hypothetical protein
MIRQVFHAALVGSLAVLPACSAAVPAGGVAASPQGARAGSGCAEAQLYELGTVVSGEFTADDCYAMDGAEREPIDSYRFVVPEQRNMHAVVEAPGLDVQLALLREDGTAVKTQPYDGSFTSLFAQVPAGTYRISLRSLGGGANVGRLLGRYSLSSSTERVGFGGCVKLPDLPLGQGRQGEWSVDDCKQPIGSRDVGRYVDYFLLSIPRARDVVVSLESSGINSYVQLFTREGAQIAVADAFSRTGRIEQQLAPGAYVVGVSTSSVHARDTGRYTLSVR